MTMFMSPGDMGAAAITMLRALAGFALTVPLGIALGIFQQHEFGFAVALILFVRTL